MKYLFRLIIVASILFTCVSSSHAQNVRYSSDGCSIKCSVIKQDSAYYIIATASSSRMFFLHEPTMKIRTFNNEVIALKGVVINNGSISAGIVAGNIVMPVTELKSTAQFSVTPAQFEQLNNGVAKVRLSMSPQNHERTFKKDKIGKKLYQFYLDVKDKEENF
ncbi:MAG: hypothetical protein KBS94_01785 [Prevotella sp.]|nr:hypothetical protein [Candidatus Equicola faecalis]